MGAWVLYIVLAYLLGSVPFGYVISRFIYGRDIRKMGSGNIGATNVYRNLGWPAGISTGLGDVLKGVVPVLLARWSGIQFQWLALVGFAAVAGHCFPLFLHFRGGKGVSTTIAVLLALKPTAGLAFIIIWIVVLLTQGRVSVASLGAAAAMPVMTKLFFPDPGVLLFVWLSAILVFFRHHENIRRLMNGSEKQVFNPGTFWSKQTGNKPADE